jgi:hypothetical protein
MPVDIRKPVSVGLVLLCVVVGVLAFGAAAATATPGYAFVPPSFGSTSLSVGVTVDNSAGASAGDVYQAALEPGVLAKFNAAGEPVNFTEGMDAGTNTLTALSGVGFASGQGPWAVAIDAATGDIYASVEDPAPGKIDEFNSAGLKESLSGGAFEPVVEAGGATAEEVASYEPSGVAVDDSCYYKKLAGAECEAADPSNGDVYVADRHGSNSVVYQFTAAGKYLGRVGKGVLTTPVTLAVDSSGQVYVVSQNSNVAEFGPTGASLGVFGNGEGTNAVAIDHSTGDIFLYESAPADVVQYDATGTEIAHFGSIGTAYGLAVGEATHTVYVSSLSPGEVLKFELGEPPEAPVTGAASEVSGTTAQLHGELNPGGATGELEYHFVYTKTAGSCAAPSEGGATPLETVAEAKNAAVKAEATGLAPKTKYKFCLESISPFGSAFGSAGEFETPSAPPAILSESSSNLKASEARLEGIVNPSNEPTECHFQYGEANVSEHEVPCEPLLLNGFGGQGVGATIGGLNNKTVYRWRIVAKNGTGETTGSEETLTTPLPPETPESEEAKATTGTTATLTGVLNPKAAGEAGSGYEFLYRASATECQGGSATPITPSAGATPEPVSAPVTGLTPNTEYTFCLLARNAVGETATGAPVTFTTSKVTPTIAEEAFSNAGSTSVQLNAKVDDFGLPGTYYYEYGTTTSYGSTAPALSLGSVNGEVAAPATLDGLEPSTIYHFRLLVSTEAGTIQGPDNAFSTLATALAPPPDGRVYEPVSSLDNHNADVYVPYRNKAFYPPLPGLKGTGVVRPFQAAPSGDAVTYAGEPTTGGNGSEGEAGGNQYLATRSPQGRWTQANVQPAVLESPEYVAFSSELDVGVVESTEPLASGVPATKYPFEYVYSTRPGSESFQPLSEVVSTLEPSSGIGYAGGNAGTGGVPAFSHILSYGPGRLSDGTGGHQVAINILPDGETAPNSVFGAPTVFNPEFNGTVLDHAISADGSRIVWTDRATGAIYVRENDTQPPSPVAEGKCTVPGDACTVQLDGGNSGGALYWTASNDGSKVFLTDCGRLTASSTAVFSPGCGAEPKGKLSGSDLYEYDLASGELNDLTVDHNASDTLGANVQGVVGESQDGSYVYFVATGSLAPGATAGEPNLYFAHSGVTTFVTTLSFADEGFEAPGNSAAGLGPWEQSLTDRTAQVAPDGRSLVFQAGSFSYEVYHYEVGGSVVCVTCSPSVSVSRPTDPVTVGAKGGFLPVTEEFATDTYQQRWISEDGSRVFFESFQALVPQDVNGLKDVYEWERDGSGSCHTSPGCIYVLTGGTSTSWSSLLDASASGNDVFVITRAQLTPEDENDYFHVFDARVGGARPPAPAACSGAGCQGAPPAPPAFATPSSATFTGAGNYPPRVSNTANTNAQERAKQLARALKSCRRKHNRHKRSICEKQARKRYGPATKAKKSTRSRRANHTRRAGQ